MSALVANRSAYKNLHFATSVVQYEDGVRKDLVIAYDYNGERVENWQVVSCQTSQGKPRNYMRIASEFDDGRPKMSNVVLSSGVVPQAFLLELLVCGEWVGGYGDREPDPTTGEIAYANAHALARHPAETPRHHDAAFLRFVSARS